LCTFWPESDLQLELLGHEPAVSSEEIEVDSKRDPLTEGSNEETKNAPAHPQKSLETQAPAAD
jgi:hypothetical protein